MLIGCDIETGPLPDEELLRFYQPPKVPGTFDPAKVDVGRATKRETIERKIADAKAEHEAMLANWEGHLAALRDDWLMRTKEKAALDPLTGRVLAIGFVSAEGGECDEIVLCHDDEGDLLEAFWKACECDYASGMLVFHNGDGFDLPFIARRCWLLDVSVPTWAMSMRGSKLCFDGAAFGDTMRWWTMGAYGQFVKLDDLATAFGLKGKLEGCSGADFARMFHGTEEERATALEYLLQDCRITLQLARRMGMG